MTYKQKLVKKIFGPLFDFFEFQLRISPLFVGVLLGLIELFFFLKSKANDRKTKFWIILLATVSILAIIGGIIHTIEIRSL